MGREDKARDMFDDDHDQVVRTASLIVQDWGRAEEVAHDALGRLLRFPTDIDAWLEGALSLDVVDQGNLSRPDAAAWWDLQVPDPAATCFAGDDTTDVPPCLVLWPYVDDQTDHQVGMSVLVPPRLDAVETDVVLMALADMCGGPESGLADWPATTDEIVSSLTLD